MEKETLGAIFKVCADYIHVGLGGVLALFIYKEQLSSMKTWERIAYCVFSIVIGVYVGDGVIEFFSINPAEDKAHAISILIAIFGLGILGLFRDRLKSIAEKLERKFLGE